MLGHRYPFAKGFGPLLNHDQHLDQHLRSSFRGATSCRYWKPSEISWFCSALVLVLFSGECGGSFPAQLISRGGTNDGGGGNGAPGGAGGGRRQAAHLIHVPVLVNDTSVALPFQTLCGALPWSLSMRCSRPDICWQPSRSCSAPGRSSQASTTRAATLATPAATLAGQCPCSPHVDICSVARRADEIDARMLRCI